MSRRAALAGLLALAGLAACAPAPVAVEMPERAALSTAPLPPMKRFGPVRVTPPQRSNIDIARDFLDLSFRMESGRPLPWMTRFDGPVTVAMTGPAPATAATDLDALLHRLRQEARIDIHRARAGQAANITVQFLPRRKMQALVPQAACFVAPRIRSWEEFRRARHGDTLDWATLTKRQTLAVFIPSDTSPQDVRDCLHEEIAQALGPLDDLYRLTDSIFDDDNFHTVLTGFDMLVLRAYYAPELGNGTTRIQAATRLPAILARLNPAGEHVAPNADPGPTPRAWIDAIETALGPRTRASRRVEAARHAVDIARQRGWNDARMAFSWFALGRLSLASDPETAVTAFAEAARIYRRLPNTAVHLAHIDMQMAAFALNAGQPAHALELVDRDIPATRRAENAALLSTLLMIRAAALDALGRPAEARAARLDSLGWARYGFGADLKVRARLAEIAALAHRPKGG
ncbi:DUF2927 domain-containing protein [Acidimangrovimonas pyrenivorans]|uniref:DUF2927 domain-containing protein n=1 Tax=Acidimangrovimonas pyrenivorans TaxID=2030798 RepID=A0ABV7AI68_9RHOB